MKVILSIGHLVLIFFFAFVLAKRWRAIANKLYWTSLAFHLVLGMSVGLVYLYYYAANDTWLFFDDAKKIAAVGQENFSNYLRLLFGLNSDQDILLSMDRDFRSLIFVKALSILNFVTLDNYWITTAYISFFSFLSSWFLFKKITDHFSDSNAAAALAFLFFPSVVFWSSGVEKESLTLTALYLLAGVFLQIMLDKTIDKLVMMLAFFATVVLWVLKYYWAGVFFICAFSAIIVQRLATKSSLVNRNLKMAYAVSFLFVGIAVSFLHPNFYLHRFLEVLVSNHDAFVKLSNEANLIHFYHLTPSIGSVVLNSPWALVSGVFRPIVGEGQGLLGLLASAENLFVLSLFVNFLVNFKNNLSKPVHLLTLTTVSYCIVLCVFLALSTPNFGTLSRYRVGFLPFLIFLLSYRNSLFDFVVKKIKD